MRKAYTTKKFKKFKKFNKTNKNKTFQVKKRKSRKSRNRSTIRNGVKSARKYARATRVLKGFGSRKDMDKENQKKNILKQSIPNVAPASLLRAFILYSLEQVQQMTNDELKKVYVHWRVVETERRQNSRTKQKNNIDIPILPKTPSPRASLPKRSRNESDNIFNSPFKKKALNVESSVDEPTALKLFTNEEGNINDVDATHDELAFTQPTSYANSPPTEQRANINLNEEDDFLDTFDAYDTK